MFRGIYKKGDYFDKAEIWLGSILMEYNSQNFIVSSRPVEIFIGSIPSGWANVLVRSLEFIEGDEWRLIVVDEKTESVWLLGVSFVIIVANIDCKNFIKREWLFNFRERADGMRKNWILFSNSWETVSLLSFLFIKEFAIRNAQRPFEMRKISYMLRCNFNRHQYFTSSKWK